MSATLIIFIAFHFEGGVESQSIKFENLQLCEIARKQVIDTAFKDKNDYWGRERLFAKCVVTEKGGAK